MKKKYTVEQIEEIMLNVEKEVSDEVEKISQDTLEKIQDNYESVSRNDIVDEFKKIYILVDYNLKDEKCWRDLGFEVFKEIYG